MSQPCVNKPKQSVTPQAPLRLLSRGNLSVLGVLSLTLMLGACGKFAALVEAPQPTVRLIYLNPPRPDPVLPPKVEVGPIQYWTAKKAPMGNLLCIPSQDWVNMRVFNKEISFWMKQANKALDFHEARNQLEEK